MTQLKDLQDIIGLDIKSLQEVAENTTPQSKSRYQNRWLVLEKQLIEERKAPSLPAYLLYEYQFNGKSTRDLGKELGYTGAGVLKLMKKLGIPTKTAAETISEKKPFYGRHHSKEAKGKIGKANRKIRQEDIDALTNLVIEEIQAHKEGRIDRLSSNKELARALGFKNSTDAARSLTRHLPKTLRRYRSNHLISEVFKDLRGNAEFNSKMSKIRSERMKRLHQNPEFEKGAIKRGIKAAESFRKNAYYIEGRFSASSMQEGAAALLLEKYIPEYKITEGINFQVRDKGINNGGIDFLVNGEFLEWHPIVMSSSILRSGRTWRGDISAKMFPAYLEGLNFLPASERKDFKEFVAGKLGEVYRNSRQGAVDNSEYKGTTVALASNVEELYNFIAKYNPNLPSFPNFASEFRQTIKHVKQFKVEKPAKEAA